jgi:hypothetical protein
MSARDTNTNPDEFKPIDDVTCERILAQGKFINDCIGDSLSTIARDDTGMPIEIKGQEVHSYWRKYESALKHIEISIKCDKCNANPLQSSIRWENYDICLPCAAKFRKNDSADESKEKAELDAKLDEKREEKLAEVDARRLAKAQAANTSHESQDWDWGKPNPAWDEAQ